MRPWKATDWVKILVVDDQSDGLLMKSLLLESEGYIVAKATTGKEALTKLSSEEFHLVLLDVQLPDISGFEVCKQIKQQSGEKSPAVMHVSMHYGSTDDRLSGFDSGADDYIFGLYEPSLLLARVKALLREQAAKRQAQEAECRLRTVAESMSQLLLTIDRHNKVEMTNARWEQHTGLALEQLRELGWISAVAPTWRDAIGALWERSLASGEIFQSEILLINAHDKNHCWYLCKGVPVISETGQFDLWVLTFTDIDGERRMQETRSILAGVSEVLAVSYDFTANVAQALKVITPSLAEIAYVDVTIDGKLERIAANGDSGIKAHALKSLFKQIPQPTAKDHPVNRVLYTGTSEHVSRISEAWTQKLVSDWNSLKDIRELGLRTALTVPLMARDKCIGVMSLFYVNTSQRRYTAIEISLAEEIARRLAVAIDNAMLFEQAQKEIIERKRTERTLRESEARFRVVTESMPQHVWTAEPDGSATYFNKRWYAYVGVGIEESDGDKWIDLTHPRDRDNVRNAWQRSIETAEVFESEFRLLRTSDKSYRWHIARATPTLDNRGRVTQWIGTMTDIELNKRAEAAKEILAEAGDKLSTLLELNPALATVMQMLVPRIADWAAIDLIGDDGEIVRVVSTHSDPEKAEIMRRTREEYPSDRSSAYGYPRVIKTGRSQIISPVLPGILSKVARDPVHRELLEKASIRSFVCVPLITRNRTLGALTLVLTEPGRMFDQDDLLLTEDLGRRVATAIDNAQLFQSARIEAERRTHLERELEEARKFIS